MFHSISRENTQVCKHIFAKIVEITSSSSDSVARGGLERLYRSLEQGTFQRKGFNLRWIVRKTQRRRRWKNGESRGSAQKFITAWGKAWKGDTFFEKTFREIFSNLLSPRFSLSLLRLASPLRITDAITASVASYCSWEIAVSSRDDIRSKIWELPFFELSFKLLLVVAIFT